ELLRRYGREAGGAHLVYKLRCHFEDFQFDQTIQSEVGETQLTNFVDILRRDLVHPQLDQLLKWQFAETEGLSLADEVAVHFEDAGFYQLLERQIVEAGASQVSDRGSVDLENR